MAETYVYLIQRGFGSVKIGVSRDPESRLEQLQTGNFRELKVIAKLPCESREKAFVLEKALHEYLASYRLSNGEWFRKSVLQRLRDKKILRDEHLEVEPTEVLNLGERFYLQAEKELGGKSREDLLRIIANLRRRNTKLEELNKQRLAMLENRDKQGQVGASEGNLTASPFGA